MSKKIDQNFKTISLTIVKDGVRIDLIYELETPLDFNTTQRNISNGQHYLAMSTVEGFAMVVLDDLVTWELSDPV